MGRIYYGFYNNSFTAHIFRRKSQKNNSGMLDAIFLTFETIILLSAKISVNGYTFCPILLLGLFLIWKELPLISDQRTIYGEAQCMRFKSKSLTVIVILLMLIYYVPYCIGNVMLWAMCFQILESLLVVLYRKFQGSSL